MLRLVWFGCRKLEKEEGSNCIIPDDAGDSEEKTLGHPLCPGRSEEVQDDAGDDEENPQLYYRLPRYPASSLSS